MAAEVEKTEGYQLTKENIAHGIANNKNCDVDDITILDFSTKAGSNKGENFTCIIYALDIKAIVKGREESFYYIAKCLPANAFRSQWLKEVFLLQQRWKLSF